VITFPLVSIIIPTFNRTQLLEAAIERVVRQSYSNYEILVLDDGSTDETAPRVASFGTYPKTENSLCARNEAYTGV
jgi:glycosyltransferase involved in cell wall biosynthesis